MSTCTRYYVMFGLLLAFCLSGLAGWSQASDSATTLRRLEESAWREATDDLNYTDQAPEEQAPSQQSANAVAPWVGDLLVVLGYSLLGGLLILLLWLVYRRLSPAPNPVKVQVGALLDPDDPRRLLDSDLEAQLHLAWREERYRDVIRFQFLTVMRALSQSGHIAWRPEKTNRDYALELGAQAGLRVNFRRLSGVFEWSRYGDAAVSRQDAEQWSPEFNAFLERLGQPASRFSSTNPTQQP
ncbi:MAG: DUF4129 domain-containing protein [Bacteroidetes bacterium]|nr:DUF4129 domain-containing protein [Bacteroidota bacterium]